MKISVIIPVYNVYDYLEKCLNSLVKQTDKNFEVIIVNDGSTDNSQEIIDKFVLENDNMYSFKKENGGQASARNFGLQKATGEYILFLDIENFIKTAYELDQANIYLDQMDDYSCFLFDEDTQNKTLLKTREDYVMRKK